jgi:hypothetical protein
MGDTPRWTTVTAHMSRNTARLCHAAAGLGFDIIRKRTRLKSYNAAAAAALCAAGKD